MSGFWQILIIFGHFLLVIILYSISDCIHKKAEMLSEKIFDSKLEELKRQSNDYRYKIEKELKRKQEAISNLELQLKINADAQERIFEEKTRSFPWAAEAYATFKTANFGSMEWYLRNKSNPAWK